MKTRILTVLFLSLCCLCGAFNLEAQPHPGVPKVSHRSIPAPPPPPAKPIRMVPPPKFFNPVGHIYGASFPGYRIMFNFSPNGRVYREGDNIGRPYTMNGNVITVYSNHGPRRIVGTGKISRDGRNIEWLDYPANAKYRLRIIG